MARKKRMIEPNLPLDLKRLDKFLDNVKVSVAQRKELDAAKDAFKSICQILYNVDDPFNCLGTHLWFPPILMNK